MNDDIPITSHRLDLGACWCCGATDVTWEEHHVVPTHLGGEQGPRVQLCGSCHQTVHTYAGQKHRRKVMIDVTRYQGMWGRRLEYLSDVIVRATIAVEGHEVNRPWRLMLTMLTTEHTMLVELAKVYGSQQRAALEAIRQLHARVSRG